MENNVVVAVKPLSENKFKAFFQRIWRWWLSVWYNYAGHHPKASKLIYKAAMFWVFSMMVTVWQYLVMTFLPYIFGYDLSQTVFAWPNVNFQLFGVDLNFNILGYEVIEGAIGGGLGYFIAIELATFTAQIINFPLQRNITYKSHGNPYFQAMWFFIAWVLITLFCNSINSLWLGLAAGWGIPAAVYNIVSTVLVGGVSMVIFFFVNMIIFPDLEKANQKAQKKYEALKAANAEEEKLTMAKEKADKAFHAYEYSRLEKAYGAADKLADSRAIAWESAKKRLVEKKQENLPEADIKKLEGEVAALYEEAYAAACEREKAKADFEDFKK